MKRSVIECKDLMFHYPNKDKLLNRFNMKLMTGDFCFLTGKSGSGKTTLLKLIYGEEKPNDGRLLLFGIDAKHLNEHDHNLLRQNMGIIFQDLKLLPHLNALDNVALALSLKNTQLNKARYITKEMFKWMELDSITYKYPDELSAGQQQQVAIARGLIHRPLILLADEPTGNLDVENAHKIIQIFKNYNRSGTSVVCVTHNNKLLEEYDYPVISLG